MSAARKLQPEYEVIDYADERYAYHLQDRCRDLERNRKERATKKKIRRSRTTEALIVGTVLVLFVVLNINQWSALCELSDEINRSQREIGALEEEVERLEVAIDTSMNLQRIERVATEQLHMIYPTKEQIVYINDLWHYTLAPEESRVAEAQN